MHDPWAHFMITRNMFPHLPARDIFRTNRAIDNASLSSIAMNRAVNSRYKQYGIKSPMDIFNLSKGGHRAYNHDMMTGMITAYSAAGTNGLYAMLGHYFADSFSNILLENMGSTGRNLFETLLLHTNRNRHYW